MNSRNVSYLNSRGRRVNGILSTPDAGKKFPCVALAPHFTGFKELKHLVALSEALVAKGIAALRFDYADCMNENHGIYCNDVTLSGYVIDLISSLDYLDLHPEIDSTKLGVAGHSIGGATSIVAASKDSRIGAVVPVAPLAKGEWEPLFAKDLKKWEKQGYLTFNTPKKGEIKIGYAYYEDLTKYDGTADIKKITAPICIIHGTKDELIPLKQSEILFKSAKQPKKLEKIQGADHLFTKASDEKKMIALCVSWFEKYLK